jgi:hypothetical protein
VPAPKTATFSILLLIDYPRININKIL